MGDTPTKAADNGATSSGGQSAVSQANPAATIQEEDHQPHARSKSRSSTTTTSNQHSDSESTIGSLRKNNRSTSRVDVSPRQKRGTARSGSITEQIVDTGGIRKVVLETTSSSEEAGNTTGTQIIDGQANAQNGGSNSGGGKVGEEGGVPLDGQEGEESSPKKGGGKKKRRRKTRKGGSKGKGEGDENEPLLEEDER